MPYNIEGEPYTRITVDEASELHDNENYVFVDVRRPDEYIEGHVKGALFITVDQLISRIDELPDAGASHYRACLEAVHERKPEVGLEFLCSDLNGNKESLALLLDGLELLVFAHNVECVPRLDSTVRDHRASFSHPVMRV